jgi:regulatory protein
MAGPDSARRRETRRERLERRAAIDDPEVVLRAAARFLEVRSRSVEEVRSHLLVKGYRAELVDAAVAHLIALGMLDDEAFARAWIESRDRARPRGEHVLRAELAGKGIDREIVAGLLDERRERAPAVEDDRYGASADMRAAERLLAKRRHTLDRVADPRLRGQRAYALLARNGFDPDVCRAVSAHFLDQYPARPED